MVGLASFGIENVSHWHVFSHAWVEKMKKKFLQHSQVQIISALTPSSLILPFWKSFLLACLLSFLHILIIFQAFLTSHFTQSLPAPQVNLIGKLYVYFSWQSYKHKFTFVFVCPHATAGFELEANFWIFFTVKILDSSTGGICGVVTSNIHVYSWYRKDKY